MLRNLLPIALLFLTSMLSTAQQKLELSPCGTLPQKSQWLKDYQKNPTAYNKAADTMLYVPITVHIVGNDGGSGYFGLDNLLNSFCQLNSDFEDANIQFFLEGDIHYINNTAYNVHATVLEGAAMMFANNVPNTVNCYFLQDPAGNCGYNLPYAGIAVAKSCAGASDHTWTHEMGHALRLPHPFYGWEGNTYSYAVETPTTLVHDSYTYFQDTFVSDPNAIIIDTNIVELLDGSNCEIAGDGFCDTKADYINYRWECDANNLSTLKQKDPNGQDFYSDGTLYMSYSLDACQNRFSDEQIATMRANLLNEKASYLYNQVPEEPVSDAPVLSSPINDEVVQFDEVTLQWEPVTNATHYFVQVSRFQNFAIIEKELIVEATSVQVSLVNNKTYYWRLRPYNRHSFCSPLSAKQQFKTGDVSSVNGIVGLEKLSISPSPVRQGEAVQIQFSMNQVSDLQINMFDISGQKVHSQAHKANAGTNRIILNTKEVAAGVYMLGIESETGIIYQKLYVL